MKNQKLKNKAFTQKVKRDKNLQKARTIYLKRMKEHLKEKFIKDRELKEQQSVKTYRKKNKITGEWEIFTIS